VLARKGYQVCLVEQGPEILSRASFVNQARLHTGLHYPRSLDTARESLAYYERFRKTYPTAVRDFEQIYAISRYGSKTSGPDFLNFINRLGVEVERIEPSLYFKESSVTDAFRVEEPTFDTLELRSIFLKEIEQTSKITILLDTQVIGGEITSAKSIIQLNNGDELITDGLVIAAYAGINGLRKALGLEIMPLRFEIADVHLGKLPPHMRDIGFTVMDGPFWSMMPFGNSEYSSLTSVGLTPLEKSKDFPVFNCQVHRSDCTPSGLADCNRCAFKPLSNFEHMLQQMTLHLKSSIEFRWVKRLTTVKSILTSSEVDDSRPTVIRKEECFNVWTVFSGKITTIFDIEECLT
jgi:hypothetical protein